MVVFFFFFYSALLCMPAYLAEDNVLACKVVTSFRNNAALGLPSILATVILFDGSNGGTKMVSYTCLRILQ